MRQLIKESKKKISKKTMSVGCAILTYQAESHLEKCLLPLLASPNKPKILIVDSTSSDRTVEIAKRYNVDVIVIKTLDFNHGNTREFARKELGTDIVCLLTQDAELEDSNTLGTLVAPLIEKKASIAYARQVPTASADFFEAFPRQYNYREKGHIRSIEDIDKFGIYTFFCSNSCAAYSNEALDEIGGFSEVLLGEDTVATAKLLRKGHSIAYVANAIARHSHKFTLSQEFCRSFDTGLARKSYADLLSCKEHDTNRGRDYVKTMMRELASKKPFLIPYGIAHIIAKWSGYYIGTKSTRAPLWIKKLFSSQKFYWNSSAFLKLK